MEKITDAKGNTHEVSCLSCSIIKGEVPSPGNIHRTEYFDAHQDFEIPIPGFIIVSSVRHLMSIDEFSEEEKIGFVNFISKVRKGMREEIKIDVVYLIQEEDTSAHFHLWIFPRYEWMKDMGRKIQSVRPIMEYARDNMKTEENMQKVEDGVKKMRAYFQD